MILQYSGCPYPFATLFVLLHISSFPSFLLFFYSLVFLTLPSLASNAASNNFFFFFSPKPSMLTNFKANNNLSKCNTEGSSLHVRDVEVGVAAVDR